MRRAAGDSAASQPRPLAAPAPASPLTPAAAGVLPRHIVQLYVAGACLLAAGASGVLRIVDELQLHVVGTRSAASLSIAGVCAGVVLGLWYPRQLIRRRLGAAGSTPDSSVELEFAATLSGVLLAGAALGWTAAIVAVSTAEDWRWLLIRRTTLPAAVLLPLSVAPSVAALSLVGALSATALVAMHSLHRFMTRPRTNITRLWLVLLAAAAASAIATMSIGSLRASAASAIVLAFAAAVIQCVGPPRGLVSQRVRFDEASPWRGWKLARALAVCALSGLALGASVCAAAPSGMASTSRLPVALAAAGFACGGLGVAVGRLLLSAGAPPRSMLAALGASGAVLTAAALVAGGGGAVAKFSVLCTAAIVATASFVLAGREAAHALGRPQRALAWLAWPTAAGLSVGGLLSCIAAGPDAAPADVSPRERVAPLLARRGLATVWAPLAPAASGASAWSVDLGGPRWDVVVVDAAGVDDDLSPRLAARLLRRVSRSLVSGGRIALLAPPPALRDALQWRRTNVYTLDAPGESTPVAWLAGPDVPGWVEPARIEGLSLTRVARP